jgi:hypothetical protein
MSNAAIDETGNRYGFLTIIGVAPSSDKGVPRIVCLCSCGNQITVDRRSVRNGNTKSCGCFRKLALKARCTSHGMADHPAYVAWHGAKQRCNNSSNWSYADYGGRGIQFKFASFEEFWKELGPTWEEGLTLDRKDNDGHYEPGNCRWVTWQDQMNNQRKSLRVEFGGRLISLSELSTNIGCKYKRSYYMYSRYGANFNDWPKLKDM